MPTTLSHGPLWAALPCGISAMLRAPSARPGPIHHFLWFPMTSPGLVPLLFPRLTRWSCPPSIQRSKWDTCPSPPLSPSPASSLPTPGLGSGRLCCFSESESRSVMSNALQPRGLYSPWNSPGQDTGVGSLSVLQGTFPTQESNSGLPPCRRILHQLSHKGSPRILEWVTFPFSSSLPNPGIEPGSPALQADSLPAEPQGKPFGIVKTTK